MIRSMLFLPGNNPGMLQNADALGSDAVIFDLEDAVAPDKKSDARLLVKNALEHLDLSGITTIVRINPLDTEYFKADLKEILPLSPDIIMPTKIGKPEDIAVICSCMDEIEGVTGGNARLIPLIETASGVENAYAIASASPRIEGIFLGAEDLTADMRCARTKEGAEIAYARSRIVMAARAAGVEAYDTPFTDVNDDEGALLDAKTAKAFGFTGKASISPRHVRFINSTFSPSSDEIGYAERVLEAIENAEKEGKGVVALEGKMIDAPVVARARRVIETARKIEEREGGFHG